jgi:hypothetical protein
MGLINCNLLNFSNMKYFICTTFVLSVLFTFTACNSEPAVDVKKIANNGESVKKVSTNKNPKDVQMMAKLEGVWQSNHLPTAMQFFEDGSYRRYIPSEQNDPDATEEEHDNGSWNVEAGLLLLKSENGKRERLVISWIADNLIYLGDIDEEYDPKSGSKEEFAAEFGFSKISD